MHLLVLQGEWTLFFCVNSELLFCQHGVAEGLRQETSGGRSIGKQLGRGIRHEACAAGLEACEAPRTLIVELVATPQAPASTQAKRGGRHGAAGIGCHLVSIQARRVCGGARAAVARVCAGLLATGQRAGACGLMIPELMMSVFRGRVPEDTLTISFFGAVLRCNQVYRPGLLGEL